MRVIRYRCGRSLRVRQPALASALIFCLWASPALGLSDSPLTSSKQYLGRITELHTQKKLVDTLKEIEDLGPRFPGTPGHRRTAAWIQSRLSELGYEILGVQRFVLTVPVGRETFLAYEGPRGETWSVPLFPVWPNLVATSFLPEGGLTAPLIDGGEGDLVDLDGKQIHRFDGPGAIVLMEYRSGTRWETVAGLGASAVIFLPDPQATFEENLAKFSDTPIQFPRFYVDDPEAAKRLKSLAAKGAEVSLFGGMAWQEVECENILAFLPASVTTPETVVVNVNYDAASVIPSVAHGGQSASDLAATFLALETVVNSASAIPRQQNLLVLFDGARSMCNGGARAFAGIVRDLHAARIQSGRASPLLARKMAGAQPWMSARGQELKIRDGRLAAALAWLGPSRESIRPFDYRDRMPVVPSVTIPDRTAREWLWEILTTRIKGEHIDSISAVRTLEKESKLSPYASTHDVPEPIRLARSRRDYFKALSQQETPENVRQFMRDARPDAGVLRPGDMTLNSLRKDFLEELVDVRYELVLLRTAFPLRDRLEGLEIRRHFSVDISPGNTILTLTRTQWIGGEAGWYSSSAMEWENSLGPLISQRFEEIVRAANQELGGKRWFDFVDGVTVDASRSRQASPPREFYDPGIDLAMAGVSPFCFVTANDPRPCRLGPGDRTPSDPVSLENLRAQSMTLALLLAEILADPGLVPVPESGVAHTVDIHGKVVMKDARVGPFPKLPVPGSVAVLPARVPVQGSVFQHRYSLTDRYGDFAFEGVPGGETMNLYFNGRANLLAFRTSDEDGRLEYAPDEAMASRGGYTTTVDLFGGDVFRRLVVFPGAAVQLYGAIDPMILFRLDGMTLLDAGGAGIESWWVSDSGGTGVGGRAPQFSSMAAVVPRNSRIKFLLKLSEFGTRMFLLGDQEKDAAGAGYSIGRGLNLVHTVPEAARSLWRLNDNRLEDLERRGIRRPLPRRLHDSATADLEEMEKALASFAYSRAYHLARNAWGKELRIYPDVSGIAHESVLAVAMLLFFLAPWAYFMERIVLKCGNVYRRVAGMATFYAVALAFLYLLHPAFRITNSPIVIILAYTLAGMALVSLGVILQKYAGVMKRWRQSVGGIHSSDISRSGAFSLAFNLGLTNMAKRPFRTALIVTTVAFLAFAAMTFTSVEAFLDTRMVPITTDRSVPYDGILFRLYGWASIPKSMAETFEQDLGAGVKTIRRMWLQRTEEAWYIGLGWNKFLFTRTDTGKNHVVECLQGFMPEERVFSGLDRCVTGSWFSGPDDEVILPDAAARALGVTADQVIGVPPERQVRVSYGNRILRVIGILDTAAADRLVDIAGTPLSHVDFYASGIIPHPNYIAPVGEETNVRFMGFDRAILVSYGLLETLGGGIKNIAARFPEGTDVRGTINELMNRFAVNVFASVDGRPYLVKTVKSQSFQGAWKLIMPMLLVVLIMVNTMFGMVDERVHEIKMLGAVGLAPRHVSFLYLAESCAYGVAGVVFGAFLGLTVGWATRGMDVGLNINYASMGTMFMGVLVLATVLVATLIPAARAARLATPSGAGEWQLADAGGNRIELRLPFTMTQRNGIGIFAFLHEFLSAHWESTSPDFRCEALRAGIEETPPGHSVLSIRGRLWLAPYDMGVSQQLELSLAGKARTTLFEVRYAAVRISGELAAWKRANFVFIDLLRQQFLIFRTLKEEQKLNYLNRAKQVFGSR